MNEAMKTRIKKCINGMALCVLLAGVSVGLTSCEWDEFDHTPPAGKGSLIIDNNSSDDIHIYIDGYYTKDVSSYDYEIFDLDPAVYRLVLDEKSGYRTFRDDVDVIEGKVIIVNVKIDSSYSSTEYYVRVYFE